MKEKEKRKKIEHAQVALKHQDEPTNSKKTQENSSKWEM